MITQTPEISVIIALYNAEQTAQRCLDSLLSQTFRNFEIIIINDGSKDSSLSILQEYARMDARIHIINQSNQGVSVSRQVGINASQGDYIIHVDADDWVEPDYLELLLSKIKECDAELASCDYWEDTDDLKFVRKQNPGENADATEMLRLLLKGYIGGSCCNKLIRSSICKRFRFFPSTIQFREDELYIANILDSGVKICHVDKALYHYWKATPGSLTKMPVKKSYNDLKHIMGEFDKFVDKYSFDSAILFNRKREILNNAFMLKAFDDLMTLFPATRKQIIETKPSYKWHHPRSFFLRWALMGYPRISSLLYRINAKIVTSFSKESR